MTNLFGYDWWRFQDKETADHSASLGMTKERVAFPLEWLPSIRFGRNDTFFLRLNHNGWGFALCFSAHVRWGERGAPVCSYGFSTQAAGAVYLGEEGGAYQDHGGYAEEGEIVVTGCVDYVAEDRRTEQASQIAGGVHDGSRCASTGAS